MTQASKEIVSKYHFLSPKLELRERHDIDGYGVYAISRIEKDEMIAFWGGCLVKKEEFETLSAQHQRHSLQVDEELFLVPYHWNEPADYINHSCNPNSGFSGNSALVAMRPINPGEEICFDYAMCDSFPYDEFICACRTTFCRSRVSASDWRSPELRKRYKGYFSAYLSRKIAAESRGKLRYMKAAAKTIAAP